MGALFENKKKVGERMFKSSCHTHTQFCDGKSTAEEMVQSAIEKGFTSLGFSGHSPMDFPNDWGMTEEKLPLYIAEIKRLKEKYKDKIEIVLGIELDADYTGVNLSDFEYSIGSVHQLRFGDEIYYLDYSAEVTRNCIDKHFDGNASLLAKAYFERLADFVVNTPVTLVAHFDLIQKFCRTDKIFDENDESYRNSALEAVRKILEAKPGMIFEVNTGAMYRKGNDMPYPSRFILEEINRLGGKVTISSDTHCTDSIDFGYDKAEALCRECGFNEIYILEKGVFTKVS